MGVLRGLAEGITGVERMTAENIAREGARDLRKTLFPVVVGGTSGYVASKYREKQHRREQQHQEKQAFWLGFEKRASEPSMNAELPPVQEVMQDETEIGSTEDGYFFGGLRKRAAEAMKGVRSGLQVGAHPSANVSTVPAFKPNPIPTPVHVNPKQNLSPTLPMPKARVTAARAGGGPGV